MISTVEERRAFFENLHPDRENKSNMDDTLWDGYLDNLDRKEFVYVGQGAIGSSSGLLYSSGFASCIGIAMLDKALSCGTLIHLEARSRPEDARLYILPNDYDEPIVIDFFEDS